MSNTDAALAVLEGWRIIIFAENLRIRLISEGQFANKIQRRSCFDADRPIVQAFEAPAWSCLVGDRFELRRYGPAISYGRTCHPPPSIFF